MNLYVKGFDLSTNEDELEAFFSEFGEVKSTKIVPGTSIAYVSFHNREAAKNAKDQAHQKLFKGCKLSANYCEPKEQRQVTLEEKMDKKAYDQKRSSNVLGTIIPSTNIDIGSLLGTLSSVMQMMSHNNFNGQSNNYRGNQRFPNSSYNPS